MYINICIVFFFEGFLNMLYIYIYIFTTHTHTHTHKHKHGSWKNGSVTNSDSGSTSSTNKQNKDNDNNNSHALNHTRSTTSNNLIKTSILSIIQPSIVLQVIVVVQVATTSIIKIMITTIAIH